MEYPDTRRTDTSDSYFGDTVADPYRWLEDWEDDEVKAWSRQQNECSRGYLDGLPFRSRIADRVRQVISDGTIDYSSGQRVGHTAYFLKYQPPKEQAFLVAIDSSGSEERTLFDPTEFDSSGATSIEWYQVSPNGETLAIALTLGGAEISNLYLFDIKSGRQFDEVLPRVNAPTAGGAMAWLPDSKGFFYTRYPRPGERSDEDLMFYQQVWLRKIGTPLDADQHEIGKDFDRIAEIRLQLEPTSGRLLVTMQQGDSGRFQLYLRGAKAKWYRLSRYDDQIVQAVFLDQDHLLALSRLNASHGKFLLMDVSKPRKPKLDMWLAESDAVLKSNFYGDPTFIVHNQHVYVTVMLGGPSELRIYTLRGAPRPTPKLPPVAGLGQLLPWDRNSILIKQTSFLEPDKWLLCDDCDLSQHRLNSSSTVSFEGYTAVREFAESRDGTQIPMTVIMEEGTQLRGNKPVLLTGYGGFGLSSTPWFSAIRKIWLEQGGIFVDANLRGGGEFGANWHEEGRLTNKQHVFDDFAAVMQHLLDRNYTRAERLAIEGRSNGGLLMGAMLVQHPRAFRVAVSHVGIYDSLRSELEPNGEYNIPEFGTVENTEQYRALRAYSPYHNIPADTAFASVLFMSGENDGRVAPYHSRKMTAALQAADRGSNPILLRTSGNSGHGSGTPLSETIEQQVDKLAFLFHELGLNYRDRAR